MAPKGRKACKVATPPPPAPPSPPPPLPPTKGLRDTLERETQRILSCSATLNSLKSVIRYKECERRGPLSRMRPEFEAPNDRTRTGGGVVNKRLPGVFAVLSTVLAYSLRLNTSPQLKLHFWKGILDADVLWRTRDARDPNDDDWLAKVQDERFPVVRINFSHSGFMTENHMDAFLDFFMTPPEHQLDAKYEQESAALAHNRLVPVGLVFAGSRVTWNQLGAHVKRRTKPECLRYLEALLDRVFASPTRQFAINQLDLSYQEMEERHLGCVAEILKKNQRVYKIQTLRLVNMTGALHHYGVMNDEITKAMQLVLAAALDTGSSSATSGANAESPKQSNGLQTQILNTIQLRPEHMMAIYSALRSESALETLCLKKTLMGIEGKGKDRAQCLRWLALGIFYPRPTRHTPPFNNLKQLDLSDNPLTLGDVEAFVKTLRDPAGELVYGGKESQDRKPLLEGKLYTCRVKRGAKLYAKAEREAAPVWVLDTETLMEVLCQERD